MQKAIHGVFVPEEVTPFFLVEIPVTSSPLASRLRTLQREYLQKSPSVLLPEITTLRAAAVQLQADHLAAILRFFQADLLYRQEKLAAALTTVKSAQVEFSLQVPQLARYHEALVLYFTGLLYYLGRQPDAYPFLVAAVQSLEEVLTFWNYQGGHSSISHCQHLRLWINGLLTLQAEFYQTEACLIIPVYEYQPSDKVELVGATSVAPNEIRPSTEANALPRSQPGKTAILTLTEPPAWYYFALRIQPEASINHQHSLNELPALAQQTATNFHRDASGKVTLVFPTGISYEITMGGAEEDER
ncbi:MAG: hypothetical protein U9Q70_13165 [Chloroflexota bacterium]|nr:hypothetical protein [Chloroflexota bacterium]